MQQYYRLGTFDNCFQKWGVLFDCLNLKTKRASDVEVGVLNVPFSSLVLPLSMNNWTFCTSLQ
ncbi:hypothetical protein MKW94_009694 [Papaver nudicaule]|uniref:Uncharacterized protein n=1 Tax=Papaver nudicaule TaxID=74823 RepID=A0AA41W1K0_PAPNU|nr:hypothetical protein [Papaver nudicaule]